MIRSLVKPFSLIAQMPILASRQFLRIERGRSYSRMFASYVAGLNLAFRPRVWLDFAFSASFERELGMDGASLGATFAGETSVVTDNPVARDTAVLGLRISSQLDARLFLQLGAEMRDNASCDHDRRLSLNLTSRF